MIADVRGKGAASSRSRLSIVAAQYLSCTRLMSRASERLAEFCKSLINALPSPRESRCPFRAENWRRPVAARDRSPGLV